MKKVLITGVAGQDGTLMAKKLIDMGYQVFGGIRGRKNQLWRHKLVEMPTNLKLVHYVNGNLQLNLKLLDKYQFDEIYHFAGYSSAEDSFNNPREVIETNYFGVLELLEAVRLKSPITKIFIAGSSEIFGNNSECGAKYTEDSPINPSNFYGIAQASAKFTCDLYRYLYDLKIFYGILFNHESYLRDEKFLTRKLAVGFSKLKNSEIDVIEIGNFESSRDWGSAIDFVSAMIKLMLTNSFGNYIFATEKSYSVKKLVAEFAKSFGYEPVFETQGDHSVCLDKVTGKIIVKSSPKFIRKNESPGKVGSSEKLQNLIQVRLNKDLHDLIAEIIHLDYIKSGSTKY